MILNIPLPPTSHAIRSFYPQLFALVIERGIRTGDMQMVAK